MMAEQLFIAVVAGLAYGLTHYIKKAQNGQKFDPYKLIATEVIAVFVAVSLALSGAQVNQLTIGQQFALYAGMIPLVENVVKFLIRGERNVEKKLPPRPPAGS